MKITKSKLAQIVQEELSNTMSEAEQWKMGRSMKAADLAADPLYAAENQGIVDAQDDFMRHKRGEEVSPDLPSFGSAEEEEAYGMAWGKEWHRLMDIAAKNAVERKLNRPPEPMTDADREAADAELDFEATYSEGKTKITKSQLATIIKEELGDYPNFSNMESLLSKLLSSIEGLDLSIDYLAGSISGEDAFSAAANQRTFGRYAASQPALKENKMKITKSQLSKIIQEELQAVTTEGMDTLEAHMLGREHAVEVWRGEREDSDIMMMSNAAYRAGFEDATEEIAAEEGEDSLHRDPSHDYEGDSPEEEYDDDWMRENKITKSKLAQIVQEELNNTMLEGLMLEQQNVEKAAELAANMKDTPEVEAIFATLDKDPEAQKALKSILAQLPDENIEEAEDLDPAGGIATTATFLMVGNTMYHVAAGKALMGAVVAAGLPIAGGLTGLALVALAMKYVKTDSAKRRRIPTKKNSNTM